MTLTAYDLASRFIGLTEVAGPVSNPQVLAMLRLDDASIQDDATPWCSAFVNYIAWLLRLPRSKSLAARSWLDVGEVIQWHDAKPGYDVVVLNRNDGPGADVRDAPGHVGFFAALGQGDDATQLVSVLAGNQGNAVSIARFPLTQVLGFRRLYTEL